MQKAGAIEKTVRTFFLCSLMFCYALTPNYFHITRLITHLMKRNNDLKSKVFLKRSRNLYFYGLFFEAGSPFETSFDNVRNFTQSFSQLITVYKQKLRNCTKRQRGIWIL